MALTRAQYLAPGGSTPALVGQAQGVKQGTGIAIAADGTISFDSGTATGAVKLAPLNAYNAYQWPLTAGSAGQVLTTDGSGNLSWAAGGGGGGVTQIVAGTNVTISPSGGTGVVTINATGGGGGGTVTSVSGQSPIAVANGTTTPVISVGIATTGATGVVKPDGVTITIQPDGTLSSSVPDGTVTQINAGQGIALSPSPITTTGTINLSVATTAALGGVKPDGTTITIDSGGTITATGAGGTEPTIVTNGTITGTATVGSTLSYTLATFAGNPNPSVTWAWFRGTTQVQSGGASYVVVSADQGNDITVRATATNSAGSITAVSNGITIPGSAPTVVTSGTVGGSAAVGATLTYTTATFSGTPTPTVTWAWFSGTTQVAGQSATYVVQSTDAGYTIRVEATATNSGGSRSVFSSGVTIPATAPAVSTAGSVVGSGIVGEALTYTPATFSGGPAPTVTWAWYHSDDFSTPIAGQVLTYIPTAADIGETITVRATATNSAGTAVDTPAGVLCTPTADPVTFTVEVWGGTAVPLSFPDIPGPQPGSGGSGYNRASVTANGNRQFSVTGIGAGGGPGYGNGGPGIRFNIDGQWILIAGGGGEGGFNRQFYNDLQQTIYTTWQPTNGTTGNGGFSLTADPSVGGVAGGTYQVVSPGTPGVQGPTIRENSWGAGGGGAPGGAGGGSTNQPGQGGGGNSRSYRDGNGNGPDAPAAGVCTMTWLNQGSSISPAPTSCRITNSLGFSRDFGGGSTGYIGQIAGWTS